MKRWLQASLVASSLCFHAYAAGAKAFSYADDPRIAPIRAKLLTNPDIALRDAEALQRHYAGLHSRDAEMLVVTADWVQAAALAALNRPAEAARVSGDALQKVYKQAPGSALRAELLLAHGQASSALGKVQTALSDYQTAYKVFGLAHAPRGQAVALQHLAATYSEGLDYENSLRYISESIDVYPADDMLRLSGFNNAGIAQNALGRFREAEVSFQRALAAEAKIHSPLLKARILQNLADAQVGQGRYDAAEATLNRALMLTAAGPASSWRPPVYGTQAEVALRQGNLPKARRLIERAFSSADTVDAAFAMRGFHQTAYNIYRRLGDDRAALHHLEAFKRLDDRSRALADSASSALMSARFDFANQDLKITRLRAGQAERDATIQRTRVRYHTILTAGLLAGAGIIMALLGFGFVSIRRSRNQVRAANATLRHTNVELEKALAAKSEFFATTSHEIRTPLNGILGMTQVMLAERGIDERLRNRVELIHGAGETMRALVDDILDVAKMETGELRIHPAEMDLPRLLRDAGTVWAGQAETKGIALALELDDCPAGIVADEVRLRQIVFNLMSNAIKFTDRGLVRLRAEVAPGPDGETLVIRVEDSGIGIPAERLADIFEAFRQVDGGVTRRHGGTGLGLAICRNLARAMGGDVTLESIVGAGSVFTVTLPLVRAGLPAAPAIARREVTSLAEAQLLLLEPNPLSQSILRALLAPHVATLHVVTDAADASRILAGGAVDHVLADGAAFGLDPVAARRFVEEAGTGVTFLWPSPDEAVIRELTEAGAHRILVKPISAPDLLARLRMRYAPSASDRELAA